MTDTLAKALSLINSKSNDTIALEALVKAMEGVLNGGGYEGSGVGESGLEEADIGSSEPVYKHPLEDYTVSQKDIGSVVEVWDEGWKDNTKDVSLLKTVGPESLTYPFKCAAYMYTDAAPYRDPIKLHFKAHYATPDSKVPADLLEGNPEFVALLWEDGKVTVTYGCAIADPDFWKVRPERVGYIIGYCPLFFVNPILDNSEDKE